MKFTKLVIENFLTVGKVEATLNDKGLVLVQGENKDDTSQDSNGSGKSSFVDALSWCLYGETARGESGDPVINHEAGKNCRVAVTVDDDDGSQYQIVRHRKYTKKRNRLEVFNSSDPSDIKDLTEGKDSMTQKVVDRIIGATKDVFMASVYAGQERMPDLPAMTDRELKTIVEEAAGIDQIEGAYKLARERLSEVKQARAKIEGDVNTADTMIEAATLDIKDLEDAEVKWQSDHKKEVQGKLDEVKKLKAGVAGMAQPNVARISEINNRLQEVTDSLKSNDAENKAIANLRVSVNKFEQALAMARSAFEAAMDKVRESKERFDRVKTQISQPCDECGRPHSAETLKEATAKAVEATKAAAEKAKLKKAQIPEAESALAEAQQKLSDAENSKTDVSALLDEQAALTSELQALKQSETELNSAKQELKKAAEAAKALKDKKSPHEESKARTQKRLDEWVDKKAQALKSLDESTQKIQVATEVVNVFGPAGVRAHILDTVTPILNDRTAHYMTILSDGNIQVLWQTLGTTSTGELREKFNISAESNTGGKSFGLLSGGEKRKVRLACCMALQDLVSTRASKPIDLFIADEVDAAIDGSGLERLMTIMHNKAKEVGSVLVISHSDLKSWISNSVTVVKEGGKSSLIGTALA